MFHQPAPEPWPVPAKNSAGTALPWLGLSRQQNPIFHRTLQSGIDLRMAQPQFGFGEFLSIGAP